MFKVKVSPQAAEDLLEIKEYIENELQNPIAAQNTILQIVETYEDLVNFPESGIPVDRYVNFPTNYKFVLANNYSIFYRIEGELVKVVRILYSKRDFVRILFEEK
ncbi:MAG: type II toxin-antitoxin system RelE/ParE family toxin [Treponema sp.]|nr:type II toxin-antitoxin system RelE/ParE family toxin [Treponema sp.]